MRANRNQFFLAGVLLLLLGVQFRFVQSVTVNEKVGQFIAKRLNKPAAAATQPFPAFLAAPGGGIPASQRTFSPPKWIGFALMSVGGVLVLHAIALKKPE